MAVKRFDAGRLGKVERTPQGGVRVPAALTRTGILTYRNPDGSTRKELRPADEVFRKDSLESLSGAPVTEGHAAWVTPENWREHARGHVVEGTARKDGELVAAALTIQDGTALPRIDSGDLVELSCGYSCDFDATPGEYKGERYDGVQRNIRYNHVALLPSGGGRAGRDVALRLDAADSVAASDDIPAPTPAPTTGVTREDSITMVIRFDNKDYDLSKPDQAAAFQLAVSDFTVKAKRELDQATARADGAEADLKKEKESFQARLDSAVSERVTLNTAASTALGAEYRTDGKSAREIMIDVIRADDKDFTGNDSAGKPRSDDYVRALFDRVVAKGTRADSIERVPEITNGLRNPKGETREDGEEAWPDVDAAQRRMRLRNRGIDPDAKRN